MEKKKTILVTGSAGFIGFHCAIRLLEMGYKVIGVDNFNDYYDVSLKEDRNKILVEHDSFRLYRGDLSDEKFCQKLFVENEFSKICHLAAQAGVRYSLENPRAYLKSNMDAFLNILESARHNNIKDIVYASSSSVYGNNTKIPFSVLDNVDRPISLYASTKLANELLAYNYHHLFALNITGLRFFTVIGPWGRPDMALMKFTKAILNNEEIKVFGQGKMKRDFTYIDDIVLGIVLALNNVKGYNLYNLGNNKPVNLEYFISLIEKNLNKKAKKRYYDMQAGDVRETYADILKTKNDLNWEPKTKIEEAISSFTNWYMSYYGK